MSARQTITIGELFVQRSNEVDVGFRPLPEARNGNRKSLGERGKGEGKMTRALATLHRRDGLHVKKIEYRLLCRYLEAVYPSARRFPLSSTRIPALRDSPRSYFPSITLASLLIQLRAISASRL